MNYILILAGFIGLVGVGVECGEIIESDKISNWGVWGLFDHCPNGTFVQAFQLRSEPYKGPLIDDTAANAVRLFCGDPDNINTRTISSLEGHWGEYGKIFRCNGSNNFIHGFQLRVEVPFILDDETATDNVRFYCNNDEPNAFLEGDGLNRFGLWRSIRKCAKTEAICALSTQVQPDQGLLGDDTALNNISAECCDLPGHLLNKHA